MEQKKTMSRHVLSLIKNISYRFKKLCKLKQNNTKESTLRQQVVILLKMKDEEKILKETREKDTSSAGKQKRKIQK